MRSFTPKILFFINGSTPSSDEVQGAQNKFGPGVAFRNVLAVPVDPSPGSLEDAHGVAGDVPAAYSKYPRGLDGLNKWRNDNPDAFKNGEFPLTLKPSGDRGDVLPPDHELAADHARRHRGPVAEPKESPANEGQGAAGAGAEGTGTGGAAGTGAVGQKAAGWNT